MHIRQRIKNWWGRVWDNRYLRLQQDLQREHSQDMRELHERYQSEIACHLKVIRLLNGTNIEIPPVVLDRCTSVYIRPGSEFMHLEMPSNHYYVSVVIECRGYTAAEIEWTVERAVEQVREKFTKILLGDKNAP